MAAAGWGVGDPDLIARDRLVLWSIRLPRIVLASMVGALLAAAGAIMQACSAIHSPIRAGGCFERRRAGGGLDDRRGRPAWHSAAIRALTIAGIRRRALGHHRALQHCDAREPHVGGDLPVGGARDRGRSPMPASGFWYLSLTIGKLRDITFWMLGSLGGATWPKTLAIAPFAVALIVAVPLIARGLDLLVLGEAEAFHMGVEVERLKRYAILLVSAITGAAVAVAGVIGFVGIVVAPPVRLMIGPGHRLLLPACVVLGAILMVGGRHWRAHARRTGGGSDWHSLTAAIGAPFFLAILLRQRSVASL